VVARRKVGIERDLEGTRAARCRWHWERLTRTEREYPDWAAANPFPGGTADITVAELSRQSRCTCEWCARDERGDLMHQRA
jgi:hypothetical protein